MTVGFSKGAKTAVELYAKGDKELLQACFSQLGEAITNIPRVPGLEIDSADNAIFFAGVPLSFIRDWGEGKFLILTTSEAQALDMNKPVGVFTITI